MSGDLAEYASNFQTGGRVRVGVPLAEGGSFQEWGVVCSLERDLLEIDLSRDFLPQQASFNLGRVLDLGLLDHQGNRRCRAMVVGEQSGRRLALRLVEGFVPFEPREFFRQDVYLPLDYRLASSQIPDRARELWQQSRWNLEFASQKPAPGESAQLSALREELAFVVEKRKAAPPVAANLSGGGVRLNICEKFRPGMLINLSIYLPQPERVLEIVGEVVQVRPAPDKTRFSTSLRYRFIDEGDRDRLIGYISSQQLLQLARQRPRTADATVRTQAAGGRRWVRIAIAMALLAAFVGCEVRSIVAKRERGEKHEIERIFEQGISNYLRQRQ
jgi:hypothetical protein